jgi:hypothetical protein
VIEQTIENETTSEQVEGNADAAIEATEAKGEKWLRTALIIGGIILALLMLLR